MEEIEIKNLAKSITKEINSNLEGQVQEAICTLTISLNTQFKTLSESLSANLAEVIKYINAKHDKDIEAINKEISIMKRKQKAFENKHSFFSWFQEKPIRIAYLAGIISAMAVIIKYI